MPDGNPAQYVLDKRLVMKDGSSKLTYIRSGDESFMPTRRAVTIESAMVPTS